MKLFATGVQSASVAAIAAALVAGPAYAQEAGNEGADVDRGFDTIVVTARKVGESEQTLPISIAAFGSEELEAKSVQSVNDLQRIAPGLSISANSQGNAPLFAIRGTATENLIDGGIAVYFDDMPVSSPIAITNAFYDVSSVEILKGPQGTQFGRNTTGGTISVRANKPTDVFEGYVKAGYGNYNRTEVEGMINLPVNDVLKFRFAGNYVKRDGYVKNLADDPNDVVVNRFWDEDHFSLRGSMRMEGDNITSDLVVSYYDADEIPNTAIAVAFGAPAGVPALSPENFGAQLGGPGFAYIGPDISGVQRDYYQTAKVVNAQHVLNWDISDNFAIRNVLGFEHSNLAASQNSAGYTIASINVLTENRADLWVEDLTLRYTSSDDRFRFSVGAYYSQEDRFQGVVANAIQTLGPVFIAPTIPIEFTANQRLQTKRDIESKAVYANADFDITDQINIFGGIRYNWDKASIVYTPGAGLGFPDVGTDFTINNVSIFCNVPGLAIYPTVDLTTCTGRNNGKWEETSWNFGVNFTVTDDVLVYAKASRGYLAGGLNNNLRELPVYAPETNNQYEVGVKADWYVGNMPVRTNIAGYISKIKNKQIVQNTNYDDGASANGVLNAAKETVKGIDAEIQFSPIDALTFDVNYSFIDAKFDEFIFPALGGPVFTLQPSQNLTGEPPARVPKHQLNVAATADILSDASTGDLSVTVSAYYTSTVRARNVDTTGPFGDSFITMSDYWLANASLNWKNIAGSPVSGQLWAKNIFDKEYEVLKDAQFFVFGYANSYFGEPRTYGISLRYDF